MSWSRPSRRDALRPLLAAALAVPLAACFRPLYGPTASGVRVQDQLAAIEIDKINVIQGQERLAHNLRSELFFDLDGSGKTSVKRYRLSMDASESVQFTTTDTITGRADSAVLNVNARFKLTSLDGKQEVLVGVSRGSATYSRDPQRFAALRAARDAEIRAAKQVSDEIRVRLATLFATSP
jgi:LPS-assembly lipoprotein